jgi:hypothetical protein
MGYIGCYSADSTAEGYRRIGGNRMWGPYDVAGGVVQAWTTASSSHWQQFENQVQLFGPPVAVWIQICIFTSGATIDEVRQMVRAARAHAPNAFLYVTGQPDYEAGHVCSLVGPGGPALTDSLAKQIAEEDPDVHYAGTLGPLYYGDYNSDPDDGCQATTEGEDKLGTQAKAIWGQP